MDTLKLARQLKKGRPAPVYLVAGEEGALVDRALNQITDKVLSESNSADLALTRLDGKGASADEIESAARTASLFGGRRLVIIREAYALRPTDQKLLVVYLEKPVDMTTLVLVARGIGAGTRDPKKSKAAGVIRKYKKAVEKGGGVVVDCPRPKARDLPRMAEQVLSEHGLQVSSGGVHTLVEAVGEDLEALIQAAEKLALYLGGSGRVEEEHVLEVVADTRSQSVFALTDAVGEGAVDRALRVLSSMLRDGEAPLAVLGHLARHFRNLARVASLDGRGKRADAIQKQLGLHPFVVKKCLLQCRRFDQWSLARRLRLLAEADRDLKGGRLPDALRLQKLVMSLCEKN